jgi:hypothetical protein
VRELFLLNINLTIKLKKQFEKSRRDDSIIARHFECWEQQAEKM